MPITQVQRQFIQQRAKNCCEYCRLSSQSVIVPFHVDHIIPVKHDGSDDMQNLCWACYHCNVHKSHDLTGFDPLTNQITPLYHPREKIWAEHFRIRDDMRIEGLTPVGRTTVRVLQINIDERIESRQILTEIGEYPCSS